MVGVRELVIPEALGSTSSTASLVVNLANRDSGIMLWSETQEAVEGGNIVETVERKYLKLEVQRRDSDST